MGKTVWLPIIGPYERKKPVPKIHDLIQIVLLIILLFLIFYVFYGGEISLIKFIIVLVLTSIVLLIIYLFSKKRINQKK